MEGEVEVEPEFEVGEVEAEVELEVEVEEDVVLAAEEVKALAVDKSGFVLEGTLSPRLQIAQNKLQIVMGYQSDMEDSQVIWRTATLFIWW